MKFHTTVFNSILLLIIIPSAFADSEISDPLEPMNRGIFWFNDKVDTHLFEPVAQSYHDTFPSELRNSVANFFENLKFPIFLVSDLIQLKFKQVPIHTSRFVINSTVGIAGLFDPAEKWGLASHEEDFGVALGYHGVGDGPYIVLPFLGPSSARDLLGTIVDTILYPTWHLGYFDIKRSTENTLTYSLAGVNVLKKRERLLEAVKSAKSASLDYYLFTRSAFKQSRDGLIYDGAAPETDEFGE